MESDRGRTAGAGTFALVPTSATLGARVEGIDLRDPDGAVHHRLARALVEHGMLIVADQHLSREEQLAVAERFGAVDEFDTRVPNVTATPWIPRPAGTKVVVEPGNVDADGATVRRAGEAAWRSDGSFKASPVSTTILAAVEVGAPGFVTELADTAAAWDALSPEVKEELADVEVWHSAVYAKAAQGAVDLPLPSDPCEWPGAAHLIVRRNPVTGRRSLFLGESACHLLGWDVPAAQARIAQLTADACRPPRVHRHTWAPGDVLLWDGFRVVHRTPTWDVDGPVRLRHISVVEPPRT